LLRQCVRGVLHGEPKVNLFRLPKDSSRFALVIPLRDMHASYTAHHPPDCRHGNRHE
jgi:hypothetical protein